MSKIEIRKAGITHLDTDAVVNAANEGLWQGGGVCGAIFDAAGSEELTEACRKIGHCDTGSAVITPGFRLRNKYIIHAVGPIWKGGDKDEPKQLYTAYYKSLVIAMEHKIHSVGFPLISSGIFGYPKDKAWETALRACRDFINTVWSYEMDVVFAIPDDSVREMGEKIYNDGGFKNAERSDWKALDMPEKHDTFILKRQFTVKELRNLRRGNIPKEMEDKWFFYVKDNVLYAHRSWTGNCIFIMEIANDGNNLVTVNRDPEQYKSTNAEEDSKTLNTLLNWWTKDSYDYYSEWLDETVVMINKANENKNTDTLKINGKEYPAVFFYEADGKDGYLSNWYISPFTLDGIIFNCMEQFIMYRKCMVFGDTEAAEKVLATDDPKEQKHIARGAKGYDDRVWGGLRQVIAMRGLIEKFRQNPELKEKLLSTGDAYLVESTYRDKTWACGRNLSGKGKNDISEWTGQNILGFALMQAREFLRSDNK